MQVIVRLRAGGPETSIPLTPGTSMSFGRGGGPPVDVVLDHPGLSRRAGYIGLLDDGRISVSSYQTGGVIEVRRSNGVTANRLAKGEACVMAPAPYTIEVVALKGSPVKLEVRFDPDDLAPGARGHRTSTAGTLVPVGPDFTEPAMRRDLVLEPPVGQEWQTVLALACVLARRAPRADGWAAPSTKQLASAVGGWFGLSVSDKWLSDRLDAALDQLHLPRDGTDKLPRLVARALAGDLLSERLLDEVERRLATGRGRSGLSNLT